MAERNLVGYDECRCMLTQYCDGTCRPIFEDEDVVHRARILYAEHPTYRGTTPLPWHYAPIAARKVWVEKAKADAAAGVVESRHEVFRTDESKPE